jgi:hypothetical protein
MTADDPLAAFLSETEHVARLTAVQRLASGERMRSHSLPPLRERPEMAVRSGGAASWVRLLLAISALIVGVALEEHMQKRPSEPANAGSPANLALPRVPPVPNPTVAAPQHDTASSILPAPPAVEASSAALETTALARTPPVATSASADAPIAAGLIRPDSRTPAPLISTTPDKIGSVAPAPTAPLARDLPAAEMVPVDPRPVAPLGPVPTAAVPVDNREGIKRVLDVWVIASVKAI